MAARGTLEPIETVRARQADRRARQQAERTAPRKVTSPVTVTLEGVWGTIRRRHPELPPVAIVVSSGTASLAKGWPCTRVISRRGGGRRGGHAP